MGLERIPVEFDAMSGPLWRDAACIRLSEEAHVIDAARTDPVNPAALALDPGDSQDQALVEVTLPWE